MDAQPIGGAGERWKAALRSPDRLEDDVHRTEGISAALPRGEPIYLGSRSPSSGPTPWGELGARRTLLDDLATLTRNTLVTAIAPEQPFTLIARPTPVQQRARDLLGLSRTQ
jgi:hypothetical protein